MEKAKMCAQCGELRPQSQYRPYYGRAGYYRHCKICEKVNNRYKYLERKSSTDRMLQAEIDELAKINQLYDLQRTRGLKPPGSDLDRGMPDLDAMIAAQQQEIERVPEGVSADTPTELLMWLDADLVEHSTEYLEELVDTLTNKYRPQIGIENLQPVYDNTHRDVLNDVIRRIEDYVDSVS